MRTTEMLSHRLRTWLALIAAVAVLASCGGGGKRLTKPDLIAAWDGVCTTDGKPIDDLSSQLPGVAAQITMPQFADAFAQLLPLYRKEVSDLKAIKPPEEDQATINGILDDLDKIVDQIDKAQKAAAAGDLDAFKAVSQELGPILDRANRAAVAYGFRVCGS